MAERDIKSEKEKVKQLLAKGKEKGTLSYEEIMDSLSSVPFSWPDALPPQHSRGEPVRFLSGTSARDHQYRHLPVH